jgi:hypothetical protein
MFVMHWRYRGVLSSALLAGNHGHVTLKRRMCACRIPSPDRLPADKAKALESDDGESQARERPSVKQRRLARESLALV